jgi:hypothetical protein
MLGAGVLSAHVQTVVRALGAEGGAVGAVLDALLDFG